jgi:hypothetical protein
VLHDNMPMEADAMERERNSSIVSGTVSQGTPVAGARVTVFPAGYGPGGSTAPAASAVSSPAVPPLALGEYFLFLEPGTYDVYVTPPGGSPQLFQEDLVIVRDEDGDDNTDEVDLDIAIAAPAPTPAPRPDGSFIRGDTNGGGVDISDALHTLSWLFTGGAPASCPKAADVNDDGKVDVSDPLALLRYLFLGGEEPRPPFRSAGEDPTPDSLLCSKP